MDSRPRSSASRAHNVSKTHGGDTAEGVVFHTRVISARWDAFQDVHFVNPVLLSERDENTPGATIIIGSRCGFCSGESVVQRLLNFTLGRVAIEGDQHLIERVVRYICGVLLLRFGGAPHED